jgi:hypothetical protein
MRGIVGLRKWEVIVGEEETETEKSSAKASYLTSLSGLMTASFRDSADDVDIIGEVGGRMERMVGKLGLQIVVRESYPF